MWMDFFLDPVHPRRTSALLLDQIRDAIADGRLRPGDRLPTSRFLAADLGVSRSTVTTVYDRLVAEGILEARVGDGTFVAQRWVRPAAQDRQHRPPPAARPHRPAPAGVDAGTETIDLRTGRPDPALFPLKAWRRAVLAAGSERPPSYGDAAGTPELRAAIAARVGRVRGLAVTADQVLVTAGAQQAFTLCARVLVAPGEIVAIEDPGYEPARRAFVDRGARIDAVPVDRDGPLTEQIDPAARVVYVTPSHQSPTGVTMSAARRRSLLERAYTHDQMIIEDDYDTEYRYVDRPLEPLHRLDPEGRVIYLATFSKTLSPSLRLGFVVGPRAVIDDLTDARAGIDVQPPHLTQAALADLILSGELDRHIRRSRSIYRARHDLVADRIATLHRDGLIPPPWPSNAGLHTMIELPAEADAGAIRDRLAEDGIIIDTTDHTWVGPARPGLTVGYGLADLPALDRAFDAIAATIGAARFRGARQVPRSPAPAGRERGASETGGRVGVP
ncbi:MAG: PLP-dependent aminotransferase family protein [Ilumatobacteraceae bacterium]